LQGNSATVNETVWYTKQDLQFVKQLDTVTLSAALLGTAQHETGQTAAVPLVVKGVKSIWSPTAALRSQLDGGSDPDSDSGPAAATVLAMFGSDKSAAAVKRPVGKGFAFYAAFLPGLSYYDPGGLPCRACTPCSFSVDCLLSSAYALLHILLRWVGGRQTFGAR
jgi:hypothetical protein